jgi:hypothetical protein
VSSLGVTEHWDNDLSRQYSRNKDPKDGKGIELIYLGSSALSVQAHPLPRPASN